MQWRAGGRCGHQGDIPEMNCRASITARHPASLDEVARLFSDIRTIHCVKFDLLLQSFDAFIQSVDFCEL